MKPRTRSVRYVEVPRPNPARDALVAEVTELLCSRCSSQRELLDVLVPITAAALSRTKAEPSDVQSMFLRVAMLLDHAEQTS